MGGDDVQDWENLAGTLHVLAAPTRLKILLMLAEGESDVTGIRLRLGCPQPTASHHLALLRGAGVVHTRRDGKRVYYRLAAPPPSPGAVHLRAGKHVVTLQLAPGASAAAAAAA